MPDAYRVRTEFTGQEGTPYVSTQFFEQIGVGGQAGADEAAAKVVAFWSALAAVMDEDLTTLLEPLVDLLDETTGVLQDSFVVSGSITQPSAITEELPSANQGLLQLRTGQIRNGVRVLGRIFIPGTLETSSVAGVPGSTYRTALTDAGANLLGSAIDAVLCVYRRPLRDAEGTLIRNGEAIAVSSVTAATYWAILRSRRD